MTALAHAAPLRSTRMRGSLAVACVLALAACAKGGAAVASDSTRKAAESNAGSISMCKLMPKEAVNAAIGSAFTIVEASDENSSSSCHYSSETDPAGLSLDMQWILPSEYGDPAEHAAMQKAAMGGARLGGKLESGMVPGAAAPGGGPLHIPTGPVEGVGDEATQNMLLLTARKGDYLLMVQLMPDVMTLMKDSTEGPRVLANEKKLAVAVLSKV